MNIKLLLFLIILSLCINAQNVNKDWGGKDWGGKDSSGGIINDSEIYTSPQAVSLFAQKPAMLNIAVNDLSEKGIEQSTAAIISDRLRSELINTGVFRVMERNEMDNILKEQGFQKSGACDDASCLVEVGQLLGVERMVAGTIGKIEKLYTISLRMINIATGQIMFTVNEDFEGDIKDLLANSIGNAARKLAEDCGGEIYKASLSGKKGDLYIASEPSDATVEIDGKIVKGKTPITLKDIPAGEHRVVVRKGEFYGLKAVSLAPNDLQKVGIAMEIGKGSLKVFTIPDSALVMLDGTREGISPCKIENIPAGKHQLFIIKNGFLAYASAVDIMRDETINISISLKKDMKEISGNKQKHIEKHQKSIEGNDPGTKSRHAVGRLFIGLGIFCFVAGNIILFFFTS